MATLKFNEFCDKKRAFWVLQNIDYIQKQNEIPPPCVTIVKQYCKEVLASETGVITRVYAKSDFGRHFLKSGMNGYQNMKKIFRSTLAHQDYYDLDIENCQPTILLQYCDKHNISVPTLEHYVKNRPTIIEESQLSKKTVKDEVIKIIYGGKINYDNIENCSKKFRSLITNIETEVDEMLNKIYDLNQDVSEYVKKTPICRIYDNEKGTVCALKMQDIEDSIVKYACKYLRIKKYDIGSIIFDGLMLRNTIPLTEKIINDLNQYCTKNTDYIVKFIIKPFEDVIEIPENELNYEDETFYIDDDMEGVNIIIRKLGDKIIKCKGRYFIKTDSSNIYKEDVTANEKEVTNYLIKFIGNLDIKMNYTTGPKPYSRMNKGIQAMLKSTMANLEDKEDFVSKLWTSNLYKLCFLDGYYDYKTQSFKKYDNETYTTVFVPCSINDIQDVSGESIEYLKKKVLKPILYNKDQRKYMLNWLGRGLAGEYTEKTWAVGLGNRNSGKSVITDLCKSSLGGYCTTFTAEQLSVSRAGCGDIEKKLGWSIPFEFSRLNFSNELRTMDDEGKPLKLDGDVIKKVSSGGDDQKARLNYKNSYEFKIQGRMLLFMNDLMGITVPDAYQTVTIYNYQSIFVDELTDEMKQINNIKNTQCRYFLKDNNIKLEIANNNNLKYAFIKLLIDNYTTDPIAKPEILKNNNSDFKESENDEVDQLKELFTFTREEKDKIPISEFNNYTKHELKLSKAKAKLLIQKLGCTEGRNASERYYTGIKTKF